MHRIVRTLWYYFLFNIRSYRLIGFFMKYFALTIVALGLTLGTTGTAIGQETEVRVVDQVVAQVNEGVITLSRVKREMKMLVDQEVAKGKTAEEAERLINEKKGELIANMINEELIVQRSKEMKIDAEVDATVNRRALDIMKQYDLKTLDELYKAMEAQGVNPQEIRETWRQQATRELVVQQELHRKVYWEATPTEVKAFYDKNKAKFTKPETVSISEIFLGYAGRDEAAVREKAKQLVTQLRAGGDFDKLAAENADPGQVTEGRGKAQNIMVGELNAIVADPLKSVKVGGFTDPIEVNNLGVIILRVDGRDAASSESQFNENAVRSAILQEKLPEAYKKYMSELRRDSYIKINDEYRPLVAPILFADERAEKTAAK